MRQNLFDSEFVGSVFKNGTRFQRVTIPSLPDNYPVTVDHPQVIIADPDGGAKDILLPAEADSDGLFFIIVNIADAAENIVAKDDSDTDTIATIGQSEIGFVFCDGTTWRGVSWVA